MDIDQKENCIWEHYKKLLEESAFDEYDILGFLIFIRNHLDNKYGYIREFSDLIAHRKRDRGLIMQAIQAGIQNDYETESGSKAVKEYNGINYIDFQNEWRNFGEQFNIDLSEKTILELTICIFSLAQKARFESKNGQCSGTVELFQFSNDKLSLCTTENEKKGPFVCFAQCKPIVFKKIFSAGFIEKTVETYRSGDTLHLKATDGTIII